MKDICIGIKEEKGVYYCGFCGAVLPTEQRRSFAAQAITGNPSATALTILECPSCESIIWNGKKYRVMKGTLCDTKTKNPIVP